MKTKVLVVDDSASDRLIIQNMLNDYNVLLACDGIEAMRQIEDHDDINLVILDLNMPHMDGFQVLEALKSDDRYKRIRTLILTNNDELDNEIKGLKLGAVDYIRKPLHMDSLRIRINTHAELFRIQDILEKKLYEQGLAFDTIFNQAPIGIVISHSMEPSDPNSSVLLSVNSMFMQITGRTKEELVELGWAKITHPDDLDEDVINFNKLRTGEITSYSMEKRYIRPDNSVVWVYMTVAPLNLAGNPLNHICLVQDITTRKAYETALLESERSKSVLLSNLPGLAYRCNYDPDWTMQFVSAGCLGLTGHSPESLLYNRDLCFNDIIAPEYRKSLWKEWKRILSRRLPFKFEYEIITATGARKWVLEMGQGIYNKQGEVEALEGIILDISDRKKIELDLKYNSEHDRWTGLYNRTYLENLLNNEARTGILNKRALVGINMSAVQSLTSIYGFHYTQELIKKAVEALSQFCTNRHLLFNTYENRFVFYITCFSDKTELFKFCKAVIYVLEPLFTVEKINVGLGVIEVDNENIRNVDQLLKNLLIASERAFMNDCGFDICFFEDVETQIVREQEIKRELIKTALDTDNGGLFLQYQPILDLKTNRICGFEALARFVSESYGLISPLEFIPITEKTRLIIHIGRKIIRQAFRFLNRLKENGFDGITVSINVSAIQLLKEGFNRELFDMITESGVNPANISLEITESIFSDDNQELNRILGELMDSGIQIAIDDFGTGYSSLAREWELNVSCLKIDKYFIDKLLFLKDEEAITGDIISMAHKLGHHVVAEGVEHESQLRYLKDHDCDKIQGYLINRPVDEDAAIEYLITNGHQVLLEHC